MNQETIKTDLASLHDAYAASYDQQVIAYDCYLAEALFGLCFDYIHPGETILDLGIGSGLSAIPFAKAGMRVYGMDFSPAMLELCRAKEMAIELKLHNLTETPWPYLNDDFDHLVCCGVFHFIPDLEMVFGEAGRVIKSGGTFAFTTKMPCVTDHKIQKYEQKETGELSVFSHYPEYMQGLLDRFQFTCLKQLKCFVGEDIFHLWITKKI